MIFFSFTSNTKFYSTLFWHPKSLIALLQQEQLLTYQVRNSKTYFWRIQLTKSVIRRGKIPQTNPHFKKVIIMSFGRHLCGKTHRFLTVSHVFVLYFDCPRTGQPTHRQNTLNSKRFYYRRLKYLLVQIRKNFGLTF